MNFVILLIKKARLSFNNPVMSSYLSGLKPKKEGRVKKRKEYFINIIFISNKKKSILLID